MPEAVTLRAYSLLYTFYHSHFRLPRLEESVCRTILPLLHLRAYGQRTLLFRREHPPSIPI